MRLVFFVNFLFLISVPFSGISQGWKDHKTSWIKEKGNANITGQAFLNQQGGGVVTCAGNYVTLTPVNSYSKERMQLIYGSTTKGYLSDVDQGFIKLTPEPPSSYYDLAKKTLLSKFNNPASFNSSKPGN